MCQNCMYSSRYSRNIVEKTWIKKKKKQIYTLPSVIKRNSAYNSFVKCLYMTLGKDTASCLVLDIFNARKRKNCYHPTQTRPKHMYRYHLAQQVFRGRALHPSHCDSVCINATLWAERGSMQTR